MNPKVDYSKYPSSIFEKLKGVYIKYAIEKKKDRTLNSHLALDYKNIQEALYYAYSMDTNQKFNYEPNIKRLEIFLKKRDIFFKGENVLNNEDKEYFLLCFISVICKEDKISIKDLKK